MRNKLYNLGLYLVRKYFDKSGSSSKCPCCNTWSNSIENPYLFVEIIKEHKPDDFHADPNGMVATGESFECCSQCGTVAYWNNFIAPVPILLGHTAPYSVYSNKNRIEMFPSITAITANPPVDVELPKIIVERMRLVKQDDLGKSPRLKL